MCNEFNRQSFLRMLSVCMKAGKLSVGEGRATDTVRNGKAFLIILSDDASENTVKRFTDMANYRNLPLIKEFDRYTLGKNIGREFAVVMAVTDKGLTDSLLQKVLCERK